MFDEPLTEPSKISGQLPGTDHSQVVSAQAQLPMLPVQQVQLSSQILPSQLPSDFPGVQAPPAPVPQANQAPGNPGLQLPESMSPQLLPMNLPPAAAPERPGFSQLPAQVMSPYSNHPAIPHYEGSAGYRSGMPGESMAPSPGQVGLPQWSSFQSGSNRGRNEWDDVRAFMRG